MQMFRRIKRTLNITSIIIAFLQDGFHVLSHQPVSIKGSDYDWEKFNVDDGLGVLSLFVPGIDKDYSRYLVYMIDARTNKMVVFMTIDEVNEDEEGECYVA